MNTAMSTSIPQFRPENLCLLKEGQESYWCYANKMPPDFSMYTEKSLIYEPPTKEKFRESTDVLVRWTDGLLYLATIIQVEDEYNRCAVKFEDGSQFWALYKDIYKGPPPDNEFACTVCESSSSQPPDEIVICDKCSVGYHQLCHIPKIATSEMNPEIPWSCRKCVFAAAAKKGGASKKGANAQAMLLMKETLPYSLEALTWDTSHRSNLQQTYCYCGGPGEWYSKMLQCTRCKQWFHEACLQCLEEPLLFGDRFYIFICTVCNKGPEFLRRLPLRWPDIAHLVLFNLTIIHGKKFFEFEGTIMSFLKDNWSQFQVKGEIASQITYEEKRKKLLENLQSCKSRFTGSKEMKRSTYGLRSRIPPPAPSVSLPKCGAITNEVLDSFGSSPRKSKEPVKPISTPMVMKRTRKLCMRENELDTSETSSTQSVSKSETSSTQSLAKSDTSFANSISKSDTSSTKSSLRSDTSSTRSSLKSDTSSLKSSLRSDTSSLKSSTRSESSSMKSSLRSDTSSSKSSSKSDSSSSKPNPKADSSLKLTSKKDSTFSVPTTKRDTSSAKCDTSAQSTAKRKIASMKLAQSRDSSVSKSALRREVLSLQSILKSEELSCKLVLRSETSSSKSVSKSEESSSKSGSKIEKPNLASQQEKSDSPLQSPPKKRRRKMPKRLAKNSLLKTSNVNLRNPPFLIDLTDEDTSSSHDTLNSIIPHPENFEGLNNPFLSSYKLSIYKKGKKPQNSQTEPQNDKNDTPYKSVRPSRKYTATSKPPESMVNNLLNGTRSSSRTTTNSDSKSTATTSNSDISSSDVNNYFGFADRVANGEKFNVIARRIKPGGGVEYLVEWEGLKPS